MQTSYEYSSQEDSLAKHWINWCRLCAKEDEEHNINFLYQNEEHSENENKKLSIQEALAKYFWVQCSLEDTLPKMLCTNCLSLVSTMINFNERVERVQLMYLHLSEVSSSNDFMDLNAVRLKFDVTEIERNHWFSNCTLNENKYNKTKSNDLVLKECKQNDLENKLNVQIKQESGEKLLELEYDSYMQEDSDLEKEEIIFDNINNVTQTDDDEDEDPFEPNENEEKSAHDPTFEESDHHTQDSISSKSTKSDTSQPKSEAKVKKKKRKKLKNFSSLDCQKKKSTIKDIKIDASCKECGENFSKYLAYREHLQVQHQHNMNYKHWPCPACDKVLLSLFNLQRHVRIHVPLEARKTIKCLECDQLYTSNAQLEAHVRQKHKNEKPFICEECGLCLRTNSNLRQHMLIHTDLAPFECEVCKKKFKNKTRLKTHMDIHSPNKHICNICGLQLNSRATLNRHFLVHSDEMQHKCDYCGKAFKRAKALKNHLLLHTGLKPYSCDFCERTFANGSNCRSHMKKMHPEELAILEASGNKTHTKNIPKLETLKAVTKAADNLTPVVTKFSGCFAFGKKPKHLENNNQKSLQKSTQKLKKPLDSQITNEKLTLPSPSSTPLDLQYIPLAGSSNNNLNVNVPCLPTDNKNLDNDLSASTTITTTPIPNFNNIYQHLMKQSQSDLQIKSRPLTQISPPPQHAALNNVDSDQQNQFYQHTHNDLLNHALKSVSHPVDDLLHSPEESHHGAMTPLTQDDHSSNASSSLQATFYGPLRNTLPPPGSFM